ncbi:hypothetical protein CCACVL1_02110 [Corchorus capsularis]|uniref:Nucleic acid-binding protein n=1 Tax=Corchorus capsularis TaxID=210143 RepID=A0A1R3KCZ6_COCAP|nr:hypothetical protein CCACVL1_02110 [Corchorus capsularis]
MELRPTMINLLSAGQSPAPIKRYCLFYMVPGQKCRVEAEVTEVDTTNGFTMNAAKGGGVSCTQHGPVAPRLVMQLTMMIKDHSADLEVTIFGILAEKLIGVSLARELSERTIHPTRLPSTTKDITGTESVDDHRNQATRERANHCNQRQSPTPTYWIYNAHKIFPRCLDLFEPSYVSRQLFGMKCD